MAQERPLIAGDEECEDGNIINRPLAGTRRRGHTPEEDLAMEEELLGDPKEIAEHLMLIDLGRNDVGRVAEIGSVEVTEQFVIFAVRWVLSSQQMPPPSSPAAFSLMRQFVMVGLLPS